ncbi:MAG: FAD-binding protein [Rhodoferax sp.]
MNNPTLIFAVHEAAQLDSSTLRVVTAAQSFGQPVHVLVLGPAAVAEQAARLQGVARVLHGEVPILNAETIAKVLAQLTDRYDTVVAAHGMLARGALPRAAALADAAYLADVTAIPSSRGMVRPMYAGSVMCTVQVEGKLFLTVRASAFEAMGEGAAAVEIEALTGLDPDNRSQLVGRESVSSERPDLTRANVVVAGGRGLGSAENMKLIEALADKLGGAIGASRAAVDAGFAPNSVQVGQTGKVVAPDLYIAVGISGAIQHVAGIKDAKVIVAINKDPDAPIFSMADIGLVGDLFEVLPALTSQLPARTA